jgi:hypothetical protein
MKSDCSIFLSSSILGNFDTVRRHAEQLRVRSAEGGRKLLGLIGRERQRQNLTSLSHDEDLLSRIIGHSRLELRRTPLMPQGNAELGRTPEATVNRMMARSSLNLEHPLTPPLNKTHDTSTPDATRFKKEHRWP